MGRVIYVDFVGKHKLKDSPERLGPYERSIMERRIDEIVALMDECHPIKDSDVLDNLSQELNELDLALQRYELHEENEARLAELEGIRPKGMKPKLVA